MNADHGTWEEAVRWLMAQPDQRELVEACYFDLPLSRAAARYASSEEWNAIRPFLPRGGGAALDLGAGNGIASFALAKEGFRVVALEPDPSGLVGARAIAGLADAEDLPIAVIRTFGETLPLKDAGFDVVLARQVFHHAHDLPALCRELFRILKPGGKLLALRDHVISGPAQLPLFLDAHPLHSRYGGENAFRLSEYADALRAAGFEITTRLLSFDSPINYAPETRPTLREQIGDRLARWPGGRLASGLLANEQLFSWGLWILSRIDRRPGRLVSHSCRRPA